MCPSLPIGTQLYGVRSQDSGTSGGAPTATNIAYINPAHFVSQVEGLTDEYFCRCPQGFMGADCTAVYEECQKGLVCYNGGKCTTGDTPGSETCACPGKFLRDISFGTPVIDPIVDAPDQGRCVLNCHLLCSCLALSHTYFTLHSPTMQLKMQHISSNARSFSQSPIMTVHVMKARVVNCRKLDRCHLQSACGDLQQQDLKRPSLHERRLLHA